MDKEKKYLFEGTGEQPRHPEPVEPRFQREEKCIKWNPLFQVHP